MDSTAIEYHQPSENPQMLLTHTIQPPLSDKLKEYKTTMFNLGIAEIVFGGIVFVLGIVILFMFYDFGQGIWCGSFLIACGIVGVMTRSQPSSCMFGANMVLSILAAVFMALLVILSSLRAVQLTWWGFNGSVPVILESIIAFLSFPALIISIVHAVYSCRSVCNPFSLAHLPTPVQMSNGQVIINIHQTNPIPQQMPV